MKEYSTVQLLPLINCLSKSSKIISDLLLEFQYLDLEKITVGTDLKCKAYGGIALGLTLRKIDTIHERYSLIESLFKHFSNAWDNTAEEILRMNRVKDPEWQKIVQNVVSPETLKAQEKIIEMTKEIPGNQSPVKGEREKYVRKLFNKYLAEIPDSFTRYADTCDIMEYSLNIGQLAYSLDFIFMKDYYDDSTNFLGKEF